MGPRRQIHAPDQLGEELAEKVRQDDADRIRPAGRQAAGAEVRHIAKVLDRIENEYLTYGWNAAEHQA